MLTSDILTLTSASIVGGKMASSDSRSWNSELQTMLLVSRVRLFSRTRAWRDLFLVGRKVSSPPDRLGRLTAELDVLVR